MTDVLVSTAWDPLCGPNNQPRRPFPDGDGGWDGQLLQWRWDDQVAATWTGYIRFNVGVGRVHEQWVAGAYLRQRHLTGTGTVPAGSARPVGRTHEARQS